MKSMRRDHIPSIRIDRLREFSKVQDYDASAVVRLSNHSVGTLGGRNTWVCIAAAGKKIFRRLRGAGNLDGLADNAMELDYESRRDLGLLGDIRDADGFYECAATIRPAKRAEQVLAHWRHPNIEYRTPFQLSMISLVLGLIGLLLGIISLCG